MSLSPWCVFEIRDGLPVCRQCGYRHPVQTEVVKLCAAARDLWPPTRPRHQATPAELRQAVATAARNEWPACPLSDLELCALVDRCQTCAEYRPEPAGCRKWTCPSRNQKWAAAIARGATCFQAVSPG